MNDPKQVKGMPHQHSSWEEWKACKEQGSGPDSCVFVEELGHGTYASGYEMACRHWDLDMNKALGLGQVLMDMGPSGSAPQDHLGYVAALRDLCLSWARSKGIPIPQDRMASEPRGN